MADPQDPFEQLHRRLQEQSDREFVLQQVLDYASKPDRPPAQQMQGPPAPTKQANAYDAAPPQQKYGIAAKLQRLFGGGTAYDRYMSSMEAENARLRSRLLAGQVQEQEATRPSRIEAERAHNVATTTQDMTTYLEGVATHSDPQRLAKLQARLEAQNAETVLRGRQAQARTPNVPAYEQANLAEAQLKGAEAKADLPEVEDRAKLRTALMASQLDRRQAETPAERRQAEREAQDTKLVLGELTQQRRGGGPLSNVASLWKSFASGDLTPEEAARIVDPATLEGIQQGLDDLEYRINPLNKAVQIAELGGVKLDRDTRQNVYKAIGAIRAPFDEAYRLSTARKVRSALPPAAAPNPNEAQGPRLPGQPPLVNGAAPAQQGPPPPTAPATQQDALRSALMQAGAIEQVTTPGQQTSTSNYGSILTQLAGPRFADVLSAPASVLQAGGGVSQSPFAPIPQPTFGQSPNAYLSNAMPPPGGPSPGWTPPQMYVPTPLTMGAFPVTADARAKLYEWLRGGGEPAQAATMLMLGLGSLQDREQLRSALMMGSGLTPDSIALQPRLNDPVYQAQVMRTLTQWANAEPTTPVKR